MQLKASFVWNNTHYTSHLNEGYDLSIPYVAGPGRLSCWYVDPILIEPVRSDAFTGSVAEGGSVNFRNIMFNPHGHGTHTESYGHITPEVYSVNSALKNAFLPALVLTVSPYRVDGRSEFASPGDYVIGADAIPNGPLPQAVIMRTTPNNSLKLTRAYSDTNPPFLLPEVAEKLVAAGVEHLLIDLPSVDREFDEGKLRCHHIFFGIPHAPRAHATITELIYVPDEVADGMYLMNLQTAPFENDATPSRPVIYGATAQ
jgi:kynurenine formamidase